MEADNNNVEPVTRLDILRQAINRECLRRKRTYKFVRNVAFNQVINSVKSKLEVFQVLIDCGEIDDEGTELPQNLFTWSPDEFMRSLKQQDLYSKDVNVGKLTPECWNIKKHIINMKEIFHYFKKLVNALQSRKRNEMKSTLDEIVHVKDLLTYADYLQLELKERNVEFREVLNKTLALEMTFVGDIVYNERKNKLQDQLQTFDSWHPIIIRYQLRWQNEIFNQKRHYLEGINSSMEKKIVDYLEQINRDNYCTQCILNRYYEETEIYKNLTEKMLEQYEEDFNSWEAKNSYAQITLDKLKEERKFLASEIVRFHQERDELIERLKMQKPRVSRRRHSKGKRISKRRAERKK